MRNLLVVLALLVALLVVDQARRPKTAAPASRPQAPAQRLAAIRPGAPSRADSGSPVEASRTEASDLLARIETRRRLAAAAGSTYFDSLLTQTDSSLRRWPDRGVTLFRVAVVPDTSSSWTARLISATDRALAAWQPELSMLRLTRVEDTAGANVIVHAVVRLEGDRTGQTDLRWTPDGTIQSANIALAFLTPDGNPMPDPALFAVAIHEVGHALGLGHSPDPADVMFPATRVARLSLRDRATMALLYELPPGSIKEPQRP